MNTRKNTAKVVWGITLLFVIGYVPYHIPEIYANSRIKYEILVDEHSDKINWLDIMYTTLQITHCFLSINPSLNPLAMFCTILAFRRHFKRYPTCCCKTKSPPTNFELTRRNLVCDHCYYILHLPVGNTGCFKKSFTTIIFRGKPRCVLLNFDSSKRCECL
jgi:hypothetical protein